MADPLVHDKLWYLSQINVFEALPRPSLEEIERLAPMHTAAKGTLILTPDNRPEVLYLLKRGRVRLYKVGPNGKQFTLGILGDGNIFGEIEAFSAVAGQHDRLHARDGDGDAVGAGARGAGAHGAPLDRAGPGSGVPPLAGVTRHALASRASRRRPRGGRRHRRHGGGRLGDTELVVFHFAGTLSALDQAAIARSRDVGATGPPRRRRNGSEWVSLVK